MILTVQFPICDLRSFSEDSEKLTLPNWPNPLKYKSFIKYTGQIVPRNKGGLNSWVGEHTICKVNRAVKFNLTKFDGSFISAHLYHDGLALSKYEFKFYLDSRFQLETMLERLFVLPTSIRTSQENVYKVKFHSLAPRLVELYTNSTSRGIMPILGKNELVHGGIPNFYIQAFESENTPASAKKIDIGLIGEMKHWWGKYERFNYRVYLKENSRPQFPEERILRITLQRLYSEYECLRMVLNGLKLGYINFNPRTASSDRFQDYINKVTKRISTKNRLLHSDENSEKDIDEFCKFYLEKLEPGEYESLMDTIESFNLRPQIKNKVDNLIRDFSYPKSVIVMGDNYNVQQGGAIGPQSSASNFNQYNLASLEEVDLSRLIADLQSILEQAEKSNIDVPDVVSLDELKLAKVAAEKEDFSKLKKHLKNAGKWAFDVATKIGTAVAAAAIKASL